MNDELGYVELLQLRGGKYTKTPATLWENWYNKLKKVEQKYTESKEPFCFPCCRNALEKSYKKHLALVKSDYEIADRQEIEFENKRKFDFSFQDFDGEHLKKGKIQAWLNHTKKGDVLVEEVLSYSVDYRCSNGFGNTIFLLPNQFKKRFPNYKKEDLEKLEKVNPEELSNI